MPSPIRFYFDFVSAYSYVAMNRIDKVAARYGREVDWKVVVLPDILDHHTKESNLKDADLLALGLIDNSSEKTLGEKLMPSNQTEKKTKISSEKIKPSQTIGKSTKKEKSTDTDFDLDL